ncbi:hypothetical protein ENBRE01_2517 [Enteropsectra breve]|nr:hypothetical protein ENBRE01_2517 [Enteropsectra breve]
MAKDANNKKSPPKLVRIKNSQKGEESNPVIELSDDSYNIDGSNGSSSSSVSGQRTVYTPMRKESRTRIKWTPEEVAALKEGVDKMGNRWTLILKSNDAFHPQRRKIDLVNKWRELTRETSFYNTPSKEWIELNENCEPIHGNNGRSIRILTKFPYDAAMYFAKKHGNAANAAYVITVQEADVVGNTHYYNVVMTNEGMKITKVQRVEC